MAKNVLPVDFQDDILAESMNGRRKYQMITNSDGTVSFVDVTEYKQVGSNFGQAQVNATNEAVNESADKNKIIDDKDDLVANSQAGMMAGALAVKAIREELNQNMNTYDTQTIESFSGNVISSGSIRIEKKNGWCHVYGQVVPSAAIDTGTQILNGLPKPRNGGINIVVPSTVNTFARALFLGISSDGVMTARWGSASTHYFNATYCYVD